MRSKSLNQEFLLGLGILALLSACTKELKTEEVGKLALGAKSDISSENYLLTASVLEMSRFTSGDYNSAFKFGDNKLVSLEFTENSLLVVEKERDARYASDINKKLILEIPVAHTQIECAKNAQGECTNREQEVDSKKVDWKNMTNFRIQSGNVEHKALEPLPILWDIFVGSPCFKETKSEMIGSEISKDYINFKVRRYFTQVCIDSIENSLAETSVSAVYNYAMVRVGSIASPDFLPVKYTDKEETTFGYFTTKRNIRDVGGSLVDNNTESLMNHWNPNRTSIDYYLSRNFEKHPTLIKATETAVAAVNEGLKASGAKFKINLKGPSDENPGDNRKSMIVLVEDPFSSAPLGYGPQVENPATGEIISAKSMMYLAGFKQYMAINYRQVETLIRDEKNQKAAALAAEESAKAQQQARQSDQNQQSQVQQSFISEKGLRVKAALSGLTKQARSSVSVNQSSPKVTSLNRELAKKLNKEGQSLKNYSARVNEEFNKRDVKAYVKYIQEAKNCSNFGSMNGINASAIKPEVLAQIKSLFLDSRTELLRPWETLADAEKVAFENIILPEIWVPTLIHELGHNLGLRHNFEGSEDKDSFYDQEELAAKGISHEIPYSTVMEYGDDLRSLPIMGKYDIAALKFAYAGKVDLVPAVIGEDGAVEGGQKGKDVSRVTRSLIIKEGGSHKRLSLDEVAVQIAKENSAKPNSDKLTIEPFGFCTDENLGVNTGCRRFDEGTTTSEIAKHLVDSYKQFYDTRMLRNNRADFSSVDDSAALSRQVYLMTEMKAFQESLDRLSALFKIPLEDLRGIKADWIQDLFKAADLVNNFYIEVITTPSLKCVVINSNGNVSVSDPDAAGLRSVDCQDLANDLEELNLRAGPTDPQFMVIGEFGRVFNSTKTARSTNSFIDQIDIRGFWLAKKAAAQVLFGRNTGIASFDSTQSSAWDDLAMRERLKKLLFDFSTDSLRAPVEVRMTDGSVFTTDGALQIDTHKNMQVEQALAPFISKRLGIDHKKQTFKEILLKVAAAEATRVPEFASNGRELLSLVSVNKSVGFDPAMKAENGLLLIDGTQNFLATAGNLIAVDQIGKVQLEELFASRVLVAPVAPELTPVEAIAEKDSQQVREEKLRIIAENSLLTEKFDKESEAYNQARKAQANLIKNAVTALGDKRAKLGALGLVRAAPGLTLREAELLVKLNQSVGVERLERHLNEWFEGTLDTSKAIENLDALVAI